MWRAILPGLLLAGCSTFDATLAGIKAVGFDSVPSRSVVYLVRPARDLDARPTAVIVDGRSEALTSPGTFVRLELAPGTHRIAGFGADSGVIELETLPGALYFVRQTVSQQYNLPVSRFERITDQVGRDAVRMSSRIRSS